MSNGAAFKDHFSSQAGAYAEARPEYPDALFAAIATHVPATAQVWEPGCGSGQATRGLAARFARVYATDPSAAQLAQHWAHDGAANVRLAVEPAERCALPDGSVQLVAVAQALHWFDRPAFFAECERVLAPGGVLAAWGYGNYEPPAEVDAAANAFRDRIEPYWPPERAEIVAHYAGYDWPFPGAPASVSWLEVRWRLPQFLRYLDSLSATVRCRRATGVDPVAAHAPEIGAAWGDPGTAYVIRWPLFLHLRRKPG